MELKDFWRTLRRRWYLTLVVLALTIGATAYVVVDVGPDYEAEGSALVFPPTSSVKTEGTLKTVGNPYLELGGVSQARDVVIRALKSRTVQQEFGEQFPGAQYEATPDFANSAPIILFTVEGGTPDGAAAALDGLMGRVPEILRDLQDGLGLNDQDYVTARKLTQDVRPEIVRKNQIRAGLLAAAVAAGLGLLLIAMIDSLLGVRSRTRAQRARESEASFEPEEPKAEPERSSGQPEEPRSEDPPAEDPPAEDPAAEDPAAEAEPEEAPAPGGSTRPVYTYRVPVESELAVSPARSRWARGSSRTRDGRRFGAGATADLMGLSGFPGADLGPRALAATSPRTRDTGRNG